MKEEAESLVSEHRAKYEVQNFSKVSARVLSLSLSSYISILLLITWSDGKFCRRFLIKLALSLSRINSLPLCLFLSLSLSLSHTHTHTLRQVARKALTAAMVGWSDAQVLSSYISILLYKYPPPHHVV
jgi:hypothetical protein